MNTQLCRIQSIKTYKSKRISDFLALNPNQSIMVLGQSKRIKVFCFGGKQKQLRTSKQETFSMLCIAFSKKYNWFAAANANLEVQFWKLLPNGEWEGSKPKANQTQIAGLILNKDENQLISFSQDQTIKVWLINYETNDIVYDYTLENRHIDKIISICINQSETYLISCSLDQKIILWSNVNKQWTYFSEISNLNKDLEQKLYFFSDYEFAWQQYSLGIIHIFEIQNNQIIRRSEQTLNFSDDGGSYSQFIPSIFSKEKGIIIISFPEFILIIQKENNRRKLSKNPVDIIHRNGDITNNGDYLVLQDQFLFKIYQISYQ